MNRNLIYILLLFVLFASCDKSKNYLRDGNSEFKDKQFSEAEVLYRKSLLKDSTYKKAQYNLANALYCQNKDDKLKHALLYYGKILGEDSVADSPFVSMVTFNNGNANFSLAMTDSVSKGQNYNQGLEKSIENYKKTLLLNPADSSAKYNLALACYLLNKNKNNNNNRDKQDKENQQQQQQQNQNPQNKNQNKQNQSQQIQQLQRQKQQDNQRMLDALKNNEKQTLERLKKEDKNAKQTFKDKDW